VRAPGTERTGVRFVAIGPSDAPRLQELVMSVRQALARRFATTSAAQPGNNAFGVPVQTERFALGQDVKIILSS